MKLTSNLICLRNLISSDATIVFEWENNPENWAISNTETQFTYQEIVEFVNQEQDIKKYKQIRFLICINPKATPIGCIDLFDYEFGEKVGVGILIADNNYRNKGYSAEALKLLIEFCRKELSVKYIFCNIFENNKPSIRLFERCGFLFIEDRVLNQQKVNYFELNISEPLK